MGVEEKGREVEMEQSFRSKPLFNLSSSNFVYEYIGRKSSRKEIQRVSIEKPDCYKSPKSIIKRSKLRKNRVKRNEK